jgi:hypothetical protein
VFDFAGATGIGTFGGTASGRCAEPGKFKGRFTKAFDEDMVDGLLFGADAAPTLTDRPFLCDGDESFAGICGTCGVEE